MSLTATNKYTNLVRINWSHGLSPCVKTLYVTEVQWVVIVDVVSMIIHECCKILVIEVVANYPYELEATFLVEKDCLEEVNCIFLPEFPILE